MPALPTIRTIATAYPDLVIEQDDFYDGLMKDLYAVVPDLRELLTQTQVRRRHFAWDPRETCRDRTPSMAERMQRYKEVSVDIAGRTLETLVDADTRERIGSFVMASCTGYTGPTPDLLLAKAHRLRATLRRTFVGHMGCFAAFNALKVAMDAVVARPDEAVLVNCTELCSLHFRQDPTREQAVIHALFGDASCSVLIDADRDDGSPGVRLVRSHTEQVYETFDLMTWDVLDDGFYMTLSPYVPFIIAEGIGGFMRNLLEPVGLQVGDVTHWIIHPGGPKIVDFIAERLELRPEQYAASYEVLRERGNCSSSTVLLVLENLLASGRTKPGDYGVMMAFGPGLTMESMLVRF